MARLLKYDLKSLLRTLAPLWLVAVVVALVYGIVGKVQGHFYVVENSSYMDDILATSQLGLGLVLILFGISILTLIMVVRRFWDGLLRDEAYLMFTLPVTPRMLILSKAISAVCICVMSLFVAIICVFILMLLQEPNWIRELREGLIYFNSLLAFKKVQIAASLVGMVTGGIKHLYLFYVAMAIGHLSHKHRFLLSVVAFGCISSVLGTISSMAMTVIEMQLGMDGTVALWLSALGSALVMVILHMVTEWILTYKLNLE